MISGFDDILAGLERMADLIEQGAIDGLEGAVSDLEGQAKATALYRDVSGGTRAGTVAYVASNGEDGTGAVAAAASAGDEKNPGRSVTGQVEGGGPDQVVVVLTGTMEYNADLVTRHGGDQDFIGPTLEGNAPALFDAATRGAASKL